MLYEVITTLGLVRFPGRQRRGRGRTVLFRGVLLAVKPQSMPEVLAALRGKVRPEQLVLSIAAGVTISSINEQLGARQAVIRSMPNTPALIGHGITGIVAGQNS